jgi:hypothetical protein
MRSQERELQPIKRRIKGAIMKESGFSSQFSKYIIQSNEISQDRFYEEDNQLNEPQVPNDRLPAYLKSNKYLMMQAAMQTGRVGSQTSLHYDESN